MKPCAEHRETLMLDVYGELGPELRSAWEAHLKTCEACRRERLRVQRLAGDLRRTAGPPALSHQQVAEGVRVVRRRLLDAREESWWRKMMHVRPTGLVPAAVALCALVLAVTMVDRETLKTSIGIRTASQPDAQEQVQGEDLEILKHFDLLKEMESLGKLAQIVDQDNGNSRHLKMVPNTQGRHRDEKKTDYV